MRKLASIRKVDEVREIPGADNIEIVQIGGWQCIATSAANFNANGRGL